MVAPKCDSAVSTHSATAPTDGTHCTTVHCEADWAGRTDWCGLAELPALGLSRYNKAIASFVECVAELNAHLEALPSAHTNKKMPYKIEGERALSPRITSPLSALAFQGCRLHTRTHTRKVVVVIVRSTVAAAALLCRRRMCCGHNDGGPHSEC
jgi:hypothetical protein